MMKKETEAVQARKQTPLEQLVNRCIFLVRKSKALSVENKWEYKEEGLLVEHGFRHTDIGTCLVWCTVKYKSRLVLEASGNYMTGYGYYNITARIYIPGEWEKKIPENSQN
mgnify:CR=1 FL=1